MRNSNARPYAQETQRIANKGLRACEQYRNQEYIRKIAHTANSQSTLFKSSDFCLIVLASQRDTVRYKELQSGPERGDRFCISKTRCMIFVDEM